MIKSRINTLLLGLALFMAVSWVLHGARTLPNFGRLMLPAAAEVQPAAVAAATVTTDQHQYFQGETMVIKGAGFRPLVPITLTVTRPDAVVVAISGVSTGADGAFAATYVAPGVNGSYRITATDGVNSADTKAADPFIG